MDAEVSRHRNRSSSLFAGWSIRKWRSVLVAVALVAAIAPAQNQYRSPKTFFNISPQLGGTNSSKGALFAGVVVSDYWMVSDPVYLGVGEGVFAQGQDVVAEVLLKGSLNGFLGASIGPSFSGSDGISLTNDLWINALFAGLRWRMDQRKQETIHSVALFVPLGIWLEEWGLTSPLQ